MIQEAVQVLQKPTKQSIFHICAAWRQAKKRKEQNLTVDVLVAELTVKVVDSSNSAQRRVAAIGGVAQPAASSGAAEPTEQVLDASNGVDLRRERTLLSAASRAEQLAVEETNVVAGAVGATRSDEMDSFVAPPGKRARMTDEHIRKRNGSPPEIRDKQSKQPRLSSYFVISSREHGAPAIPTAGTGASSSARPGQERDMEPMQKNKEIC